MVTFVKGDVVIVPLPFSDFTQAKRWAALMIVGLQKDELILCQLASQVVRERYAIALASDYFESGTFQLSSNVRPNRLFVADQHIVLYRANSL